MLLAGRPGSGSSNPSRGHRPKCYHTNLFYLLAFSHLNYKRLSPGISPLPGLPDSSVSISSGVTYHRYHLHLTSLVFSHPNYKRIPPGKYIFSFSKIAYPSFLAFQITKCCGSSSSILLIGCVAM